MSLIYPCFELENIIMICQYIHESLYYMGINVDSSRNLKESRQALSQKASCRVWRKAVDLPGIFRSNESALSLPETFRSKKE